MGIGGTVWVRVNCPVVDPLKPPQMPRGESPWYVTALRVTTTYGFMAGGLWMIATSIV